MIYKSKTPLRISMMGGGTDIKEYYNKCGGVIVNFAIDMFCYCTIKKTNTGKINIKSIDLGKNYISNSLNSETIETEMGAFKLHKGVYEKILEITKCGALSFDMTTFSDVPLGSGLGGSSAMTLSIIKAFEAFLGIYFNNDNLINLSYQIERDILKIEGGIQDHLCGVYGGFNTYYLKKNNIKKDAITYGTYEKLLNGLVLVYTGISRDGSKLMNPIINKLKSGGTKYLEKYNKIKENSIKFLEYLQEGKWNDIHSKINDSRLVKIDNMDENGKKVVLDIYNYGINNGASSGRLLGAGNGGFFVFFTEESNKQKLGYSIKKTFPKCNVYYPSLELKGCRIY